MLSPFLSWPFPAGKGRGKFCNLWERNNSCMSLCNLYEYYINVCDTKICKTPGILKSKAWKLLFASGTHSTMELWLIVMKLSKLHLSVSWYEKPLSYGAWSLATGFCPAPFYRSISICFISVGIITDINLSVCPLLKLLTPCSLQQFSQLLGTAENISLTYLRIFMV